MAVQKTLADLRQELFKGDEYRYMLDFVANGGSPAVDVFSAYETSVSGLYVCGPNVHNITSQSLNTVGWTWADLIRIPYDGTITSIAIEVLTAGGLGAQIRLGAYEQTGLDIDTDKPLLFDAGTVAGDTSGVKEVTGLNVPVTKGMIIRPVVKWDSGSTAPILRTQNVSRVSGASTQILSGSSGGICLNVTTLGGAFPPSLKFVSSSTSAPRTAVKVVPS